MASLLNVGRGLVEKIPSVLNYVQNGLVAMWDGIENAGFGKHSKNSTEWIDLSGNGRNFVLENTAKWQNNALITCEDFARAASCSNTIPYNNNITQEIIFEILNFPAAVRTVLFRTGSSVQQGFYTLSMRCLAFEYYPTNNTYGWMFKTQDIRSIGSTTPPLNTPISIVALYNTNDTVDNTIKGYRINNIKGTSTRQRNGIGEYDGGMMISQSKTNGFYGRVYAIRIYNRVLTTTELTQNYELDKIRFRINI